jgi:Sec-independent protein translocase protein TatA
MAANKLNEIANTVSTWFGQKKRKYKDEEEEKEKSQAKKVEDAFNEKLSLNKKK